MVVPPPGRERVIQELCEIHVHSGIAKMKSLARSCVWWASLDGSGCRPGAEVRTCTKCQSSQPPESVLCPDPFTCVRRGSGVLSDFSCHIGRVSSLI